ncbi:protein transport protein Sec24A [Melanerpes formicivorus]|uniref:protein transport protein Sec24A n=1 Tax=Melanerpes formicivorus TaxID=211600 RepID=UPI0035900447
MAQPARPPAAYPSQNGAGQQPYTNGPVPSQLMHSPDAQAHRPPAPYLHQAPAKGPPHQPPGQYTYGGSQSLSQLNHFQGPGQTLHRPPAAAFSGSAARQTGPAPPVLLPALPSTAAAPPAASPAAPSPWQHGQAAAPRPPGAQASPVAHGTGAGPAQHPPSLAGNAKPAGSYPYPAPAGGPALQPGSAPPPVTQPLSPLHPPSRPPLGPPPLGGPPLTRPPAQAAGAASTQPLLNAAASQEGDAPAGDGAALHNSYDAIEGGGLMASPHASPAPSKLNRAVGYSYPALRPGYQNAAGPGAPGAQYPEGAKHFPQPALGTNHLTAALGGLSLQQEGLRSVNLLQERNILPTTLLKAPVPNLHEEIQRLNCNPELFRCTLTNIPQTQALLNKAKLPLGLLLHPFKDLSQLPVVTSSTIVRCRSCRTYINPFVSFLDQRRWKCNLCYRVNDVPEDFMYNPVTRVHGEPHKRPEVQNATIEFMAPSEYMLRPPQPPVYLFVFDVSHNAVETGYLSTACQTLLDSLDSLPGNTRTKIGFITFDSTIHFYSLQEGLSQPQMLIVSDIEDVFVPMPENLLVNLNENKELIQDLLKTLPQMFTKSLETQSALGPALQAAFKLMSPTGGRISVFQTQLPSVGMGALKPREEPNQRSSAKDIHLTPSTDFYKKLALDCSGQQVAVDLFLLSGQYSDLASLGCISRYSAGSVYYYQSYHHKHNPVQVEKLQKELKRYLTRKIGFEAVMRIRCTKGLSIHTFHGNFFVRSTDLLSLPNVNPDAGYAVQMAVEESLTDMQVVSFQSALLYTSSKGERRIRVHTMCLPVVTTLSDVYLGADVQAITGLLANMAVDRSVSASLSDARDALVNAVIDSLAAYRSSVLSLQQPGLMAPHSLRLFPLYVLALLKQKAFQTGTGARLDERIFAMCQVKNQPLVYLMLMTHPSLYRVDTLTDEGALNINDRTIPQPPLLQLSVEKLSRDGAYLMDAGSVLFLWIGKNCGQSFISQVLGVPNYGSIPQNMTQLPELETAESIRTTTFIAWLREQRPFFPILYVVKDESPLKSSFLQNMIEDRTESALSYYEFLLHIQQQVNK